MTKAQHTSAVHDWGSSREQVDIARAVLRKISVDPFSSPKWNAVIGANRILTKADDGFVAPWTPYKLTAETIIAGGATQFDAVPLIDRVKPGRRHSAFVNPPGDPRGVNVKRAWQILTTYWHLGMLSGGAFWVGFSMNQLQTLQGEGTHSPLAPELLRCVPSSRSSYLTAPGEPGIAPPHPSWFALLPAEGREGALQRERFKLLAGQYGDVF